MHVVFLSACGKYSNGLVGYAAAKAGLQTATIGLARELGPDHIRVNAMAPGVIETDPLTAMPEDRRAAQLNTIPLGGFGTPDIADNAVMNSLLRHSKVFGPYDKILAWA